MCSFLVQRNNLKQQLADASSIATMLNCIHAHHVSNNLNGVKPQRRIVTIMKFISRKGQFHCDGHAILKIILVVKKYLYCIAQFKCTTLYYTLGLNTDMQR